MSASTSASTTNVVDNQNYAYLFKSVRNNSIILSVAIYLIVVFYYITKSPKILYEETVLYSLIMVLPLLIGAIYLITKTTEGASISGSVPDEITATQYVKYGFMILGFIGFIYFFNTVSLPVYLVSGAFQLIIISMIIVGLAIVYKIGYNYFFKMQGWAGFIVNMIFYIPCMLLDLLTFIKNDLSQAPKAVYVLFIIEILLVLLYLYIPKIIKSVSKTVSVSDGTLIFSEPKQINNKTNLTSYVDLQTKFVKNKPVSVDVVNNKFAFSMWVYIVPIQSSYYPYNGDATIFEFEKYHPRLIYNGSTGKFKVFFNQSKYDEFEMPLQKWNHVVFNYTKSNVDVFVNGEILATYKNRDSNNEGLSIGDVISIGQDNGLSGGICNMVYFNRPLLGYEISTMYKINKNNDPPML
jgi:hypothetical protein